MLKNVIIVYDQAYNSGGAAKIAINSAINLASKYTVYFFCCVGPVDENLKNSSVKVVLFNQDHIGQTKNIKSLYNGLWNKHVFSKFYKFLLGFDRTETIVHIHGWTKALSSSIFDAIHKAKFRSIITLHEYFTICENGGLYNYKTNKICKLNSNCLKCKIINCDKKNYFHKIYRNMRWRKQCKALKKSNSSVIYITNFSKNILKHQLPFIPKSEYYLHNFIDFDSSTRFLVNVEKNHNYLFLGRLSYEKGIDIFCEAITKSNKQGIVVGDGPLKDFYSKKFSNIKFTGWLEKYDLINILKDTRALVITTKWYETMGLTVLEARAFGIPSIAPSTSATSGYINTSNGIVVDLNVDSICNAIERLENDDFIAKLSKNNFEQFDINEYKLDYHIKKLESIYKEELRNND